MMPQVMNRCGLLFLFSRRLKVGSNQRRCYSQLSLCYDDVDPAPLFFSSPVQNMLRYLMRPDPAIVFRKRTGFGGKVLPSAEYKFLTTEQLNEEIEKARQTADEILSIPPIVKIYKDVESVLSFDPALQNYDSSPLVFTDITFGLKNSERLCVTRDLNGKLKHADNALKKRMIQVYFPMKGRQIKDPQMFTEEKLLNRLLNNYEYMYILDRACIQYEPDEYIFQSVNAKVFQHIDVHSKYQLIRSTRHFGSMTFYYVFHNAIDGLMTELLENGYIREATVLVTLQRYFHPKLVAKDESRILTEKILGKYKFLEPVSDRLTDEEIDLDEQCFTCLNSYIQNNSSRKAKQELALQNIYDLYKHKVEVEKGLRRAHGDA